MIDIIQMSFILLFLEKAKKHQSFPQKISVLILLDFN